MVEIPYFRTDGTIVRVDEERRLDIAQHGMTCQVDLADMLDRKGVEIGQRIETAIGGGHGDIVQVEQQAAAATPCERAQEIGFRHLLDREAQIGRRILDEDGPPQHGLHFLDMADHERQRRFGIGKRQQVVEENSVVRGPGQMLGDDEGLVTVGHFLQACEVARCHPTGRADRQAHAMQGKRIERAYALQEVMRRTAGSHVVLGMHLEPADIGSGLEDMPMMLGF